MKRVLYLTVGLLAFAANSYAVEMTQYGKISSIDGSKTVQVKHGDKSREVGPGGELSPGDQIITQKNETVAVSCPDGTLLIVGGNGELKITDSKDAQRSTEVLKGTIRAIVSKVSKEQQSKPKKFRFIIKTAVATLGVRGTDFIVSANADMGVSDFHTLEGTVEIAKDEQTLVTTGGEKVVGGQEVKATVEKVEPPQVFDRAVFAEQMKIEQPGLQVPATEPKRDVEPSPTPTPSEAPVAPIVKESPIPEHKEALVVDNEPSRTSLKSFDIASWHANGDGYLSAGGFQVNWDPTLQIISHWLALRGQVGLGRFSSDHYFDHNAVTRTIGVALSLRVLGRILFEIGPIHQNWVGYGSYTVPQFTVGLSFKPRELWILDRIFLSGTGGDHPEFYEGRLQNYFYPNGSCFQGQCTNTGSSGSLKVMRLGIGFRL